MKIFGKILANVLVASSLFYIPAQAQPIVRKALFLGNSYTYVNNLPLLVAALASASGDSLVFDSHAPGGYTLGWQPIAHATDPVSLAKVGADDWDFVILQEQSQTPAIPALRDSCIYPASIVLHDSIKSVNPCSRVLFFLTWGRRFGGMQCFTANYCSPDFTGFSQMQDSLTLAYKGIADTLSGWIAPAGEAWRYVTSSHGMVLHDADNSHPNLNGSYLSACVFYDVMFGKPSSGNSFTAGLTADSALILQQAADSVTFGYAEKWNLNNDMPRAAFSFQAAGDTLFTENACTGASSWIWDFGDGQTSNLFEPVHEYANAGTYPVKLTACNACFCDSATRLVEITQVNVTELHVANHPIILAGPDKHGIYQFQGYSGNGNLVISDLTGRNFGSFRVINGISMGNPVQQGIWFWTLSDLQEQVLANGCFAK